PGSAPPMPPAPPLFLPPIAVPPVAAPPVPSTPPVPGIPPPPPVADAPPADAPPVRAPPPVASLPKGRASSIEHAATATTRHRHHLIGSHLLSAQWGRGLSRATGVARRDSAGRP